jgi:hypothetical protein
VRDATGRERVRDSAELSLVLCGEHAFVHVVELGEVRLRVRVLAEEPERGRGGVAGLRRDRACGPFQRFTQVLLSRARASPNLAQDDVLNQWIVRLGRHSETRL